MISAYARHGGHLVLDPTGFTPFASPYAGFSPPPTTVEVVPTVDAAKRTAWLTVAGVNRS